MKELIGGSSPPQQLTRQASVSHLETNNPPPLIKQSGISHLKTNDYIPSKSIKFFKYAYKVHVDDVDNVKYYNLIKDNQYNDQFTEKNVKSISGIIIDIKIKDNKIDYLVVLTKNLSESKNINNSNNSPQLYTNANMVRW